MNPKRILLILAGLLAFTVGLVTAMRAQDSSPRFDMKVRNQFFAGFAGDRNALDAAMKTCEEVLAQNPKQAEALVWHGAGLYYLSGQSFAAGDQQKGMELFGRSMKEMDDAVALAPDKVGVLIPRGAALLTGTLYMPAGPQRDALIQKALADYEHTLVLQKDEWPSLSEHARGQLLLGIADAQRRLGAEAAAKASFERLAVELKGTHYQQVADEWLKTRMLTPQQVSCSGCHVAQSGNSTR